MLEKLSSSAECTAHLFLRRLDAPVRSRQVLGPAFWRHGGDCLRVPVWWPAYLDSIRIKTDYTPGFMGTYMRASPPPSLSQSERAASHRQCSTSRNKRYGTNHRALPVAHSKRVAKYHQEASVRHESYNNSYTADDNLASHRKELAIKARGSDLGQHKTQNLASENNMEQKSSQDYDGAWSLFTQSGQKSDLAASMLHFLATSTNLRDQQHALKVFESIPRESRTQSDIETAVEIATKTRRYRFAIANIAELVRHGHGADAFFKFAAYCATHSLWTTLAKLWTSVGGKQIASLRAPGSKSPNFAGQYAFYFDAVPDFPAKLVALADRLANSEAIVASRKHTLSELYKRLVYVAVESKSHMSEITTKDCLSLLNTQERLGFDSKLHLAALGTISRLPAKGLKSSLALQIYRNYRFIHPTASVPRWVFGSLIGIFGHGEQPTAVFEYILEELRNLHEEVDEWSYQQIMTVFARQGETEPLHRLFEEYRRRYTPKDARDLNHLLYVHAVEGDTKNTQIQFNRLRAEFGISPSIVSWTILMLAHARSVNPATTFHIFNEMKLAGFAPNSFAWSIIMTVAAKKGSTESVHRLYDRAKADGVEISLHMISALVESMLLDRASEDAEHLVMKTTDQFPHESPIRLWNSLYRYYAFKSDSASILRLRSLMDRRNIKPDSMTYAALMTALVVQGRTLDAAKILKTLHASPDISPVDFHYSILIYGFVHENKYELAMTAYQEMLNQFPRNTPNAALSMLYLQLQRDSGASKIFPKSRLQRSVRVPQVRIQVAPWHALEYLTDVLQLNLHVDPSSSKPSPGVRWFGSMQELEARFFGYIITFLQNRGAHRQSKLLLKKSVLPIDKSCTSTEVQLQYLTFKLNNAIAQQQWSFVDEIWAQILSRAAEASIRFNNAYNKMMTESIQHSNSIDAGTKTEFKGMLPSSAASPQTLRSTGHQRFILSWPLSLYLQALEDQNRCDEVISTVDKVQNTGFALNSRNWNRYIQILSRSPNPVHQIMAFELFEIKLSVNAAAWPLLRRGKWLPSATERKHLARSSPISRRMLEKEQPQLLTPSYFTMINLASAFIRTHKAMLQGDIHPMTQIRVRAPKTLSMVEQTPYVRDRIQGVLLRGREVIGDPQPRARAQDDGTNAPHLLDSRDVLGQVPPELIERLAKLRIPQDRNRKSAHVSEIPPAPQTSAARRRYARRFAAAQLQHPPSAAEMEINGPAHNTADGKAQLNVAREAKHEELTVLAEQAFGEISRGSMFLVGQGRPETAKETRARIKAQRLGKLELLMAAAKEFHRQPSGADLYQAPASMLPERPLRDEKASGSTHIRRLPPLAVLRSRLKFVRWTKPRRIKFEPFNIRKRRDPATTIAASNQRALNNPSRSKTRVLVDRVTARPKSKNPFYFGRRTSSVGRANKAFSINKARRRTQMKSQRKASTEQNPRTLRPSQTSSTLLASLESRSR